MVISDLVEPVSLDPVPVAGQLRCSLLCVEHPWLSLTL